MRRVVVTGSGVISSSGLNVTSLWENVVNGRSGIKRLTDESFTTIGSQIAGYITDFEGTDYLTKKEVKLTDLFSQYAYAATTEALKSANFKEDEFDLNRVGVYIGTGIGGIQTLLENHETLTKKGSRRVSPFLVPKMITNMAAGFVSIKTGFKGPCFAPVSACATANQAIGEAFLSIKHGYTDGMIAGGTEASIHALAFAGFDNMHAMSTMNENPQGASRPFDKKRDGFVMSEGAGVLFLEELAHAQARGATILGEIIGYGSTADADHMTTPNFRGAERAMNIALDMGGITPTQVDYLNAHATGTGVGDLSETNAIKAVFKEHASALKISATKSMTGHLFGAAGGIEAIITLKAMETSLIPPTINLENPDEACDLNYVPNHAVSQTVEYAMSNGFGFGGHNATLLFKKI